MQELWAVWYFSFCGDWLWASFCFRSTRSRFALCFRVQDPLRDRACNSCMSVAKRWRAGRPSQIVNDIDSLHSWRRDAWGGSSTSSVATQRAHHGRSRCGIDEGRYRIWCDWSATWKKLHLFGISRGFWEGCKDEYERHIWSHSGDSHSYQ